MEHCIGKEACYKGGSYSKYMTKRLVRDYDLGDCKGKKKKRRVCCDSAKWNPRKNIKQTFFPMSNTTVVSQEEKLWT